MRKPKEYYKRKAKENYEFKKKISSEYRRFENHSGKTFSEIVKEQRKKHKGR